MAPRGAEAGLLQAEHPEIPGLCCAVQAEGLNSSHPLLQVCLEVQPDTLKGFSSLGDTVLMALGLEQADRSCSRSRALCQPALCRSPRLEETTLGAACH